MLICKGAGREGNPLNRGYLHYKEWAVHRVSISFESCHKRQEYCRTWVGLQQDLCLFHDLLRPVLGGLGSDQEVLQMGIQLGLFSLAEFLFRKLEEEINK